MSIGWSLGQAIFSENFCSRAGSFAGRSTKSKTTRPPASWSAVSTESVSRRLLDGLGRQPVDDHLDRVLLLLVELGRVGELMGLAVDPGPAEALGLQLPEQLDVLTLAAADHRRQHLEPGALVVGHDPVDDLLRGLALDRGAADRAVRTAGAGVEQAKVVVDLGDRADGRARVLRGRLLVDRHRGREPLDEVDVGLVHLAEELARVGRQRLDVATLALGEDRVERERGLAGPGQPREHDERVAGKVERDVLEVVLARTPDDQLVGHGVLWIETASNVCSHASGRRRLPGKRATPTGATLSRGTDRPASTDGWRQRLAPAGGTGRRALVGLST